jgi:hypothetical protein
VLRALSYFDDAEAEAPLPGEAPDDWTAVRAFFSKAVAAFVVPPTRPLGIQNRVVDVARSSGDKLEKKSPRRRASAGSRSSSRAQKPTTKKRTQRKK